MSTGSGLDGVREFLDGDVKYGLAGAGALAVSGYTLLSPDSPTDVGLGLAGMSVGTAALLNYGFDIDSDY